MVLLGLKEHIYEGNTQIKGGKECWMDTYKHRQTQITR